MNIITFWSCLICSLTLLYNMAVIVLFNNEIPENQLLSHTMK